MPSLAVTPDYGHGAEAASPPAQQIGRQEVVNLNDEEADDPESKVDVIVPERNAQGQGQQSRDFGSMASKNEQLESNKI